MKKTTKKYICAVLTAVILISVCLCGCTVNEKGFPIPLSPVEKSVFEMCTNMHSDLELDEIYAYMAEEKNIDSLNNKYEIQCLRKKGDGYQVMYVSTDRILIFDFDKNAVWIEKGRKESIRSLLNTVAQLDGIKEGDSVHVVQAVDHRSYIPFMARDEELPLESDHYTQDGYHVHIEYDAQHNVTSINKTAT